MSWLRYLGFGFDPNIGISIDANSIACVELRRSWPGYVLSRHGYAVYDKKGLKDAPVDEEAISLALNIAWAPFDRAQTSAALAIPDGWAHTFTLTLPVGLPGDECMAQIRLGVMGRHLGPWHEFYVDYLLAHLSAKEQVLTAILVPKCLIDAWVTRLIPFGVHVTVVELTSLALERARRRLNRSCLEKVGLEHPEPHLNLLMVGAGLALRSYTT